jgi:hypothetical protein
MTRRPRKAKASRKAVRKVVKRAKALVRDPLDDFIAAGARTLDIKIDKAWLPAVRENLAVTLKLGSLVAGFVLPDDADPAPVFKA